MEISLLTALLGGVLALLSPCGALLLPAFFASTLGGRGRLLLHAGVFYGGLVVTLVPLGMGLGAMGDLLSSSRGVLVVGTAVLLIVLGVAQTLGFGFDLSRRLPGADRLQQHAHRRTGMLRTLLLGAASGVAGFCAGPILGAILTLAVGQGSALRAGLMLAVYGLGMTLPLLVLAAAWTRLSPRTMSLLRGRGFRVLGRELHTTSVLTGLLIMGVGVLFWTTNGLVSVPSLLPTAVQRRVQSAVGELASSGADAGLVALAAVVVLLIWWRTRRRASVRGGARAEYAAEDPR